MRGKKGVGPRGFREDVFCSYILNGIYRFISYFLIFCLFLSNDINSFQEKQPGGFLGNIIYRKINFFGLGR